MRYITITDEKLIAAVKKKYELVDKSLEYKAEMDAIRDKGLALNVEMTETKDEINERMKDIVAKEGLTEFEEEGSTEIWKDTVRFSVIDKLANAKVALRKDKENRDRKERGEFTESELVDQKQNEFLQLVQGIQDKGLSTKDLDVMLTKLINVLK